MGNKKWEGFDPSDPRFQQHLDAARQRADERSINTPPPKPTAMFRWLHPEEAKKIDDARKNWRGRPKEKRGFLGRKKKR